MGLIAGPVQLLGINSGLRTTASSLREVGPLLCPAAPVPLVWAVRRVWRRKRELGALSEDGDSSLGISAH